MPHLRTTGRVAALSTLLVGLALSTSSPARAQPGFHAARISGMGGGVSALETVDPFAANPAASLPSGRRAVMLHAAQLYGLSALRAATAGLILPLVRKMGGTTVTLGVRTFGFDAYREHVIAAGIGRAIHPGTTRPFLVAGRVCRHLVSIPNYGHSGAWGFSVGGIVNIAPRLALALAAEHVGSSGPVPLPRRLVVGTAYNDPERFTVAIDVVHGDRSRADIRTGFEVLPVGAVALRAGFASNPPRFSGGAGFRVGKLEADIAAERHDVLGWTPSATISAVW